MSKGVEMSKAISATKQIIAFILFSLCCILDPPSTIYRLMSEKKLRWRWKC
jgi:hypothetical protein